MLRCVSQTGQLDDMDLSAIELHFPRDLGKQRVIPAHADVGAGEEFRAALANDYSAWLSGLTTVEFYPSILGIAVSAVT